MDDRRALKDHAHTQAERVRAGAATRGQALAALAEQFPGLSRRAARDALAQALFESR